MPSNPMRDHYQRTVAQKQQQAKVDANRPLGGLRPTGRLQSAAAATANTAAKLYAALEPSSYSIGVDLANGGDIGQPASGNFELRMFNDLQRLKAIQSIHGPNGKVELKREIFPSYIPYIEGTLAVASPAQNDVLMHLMVWALDLNEYGHALRIAEYALLNGLVMPDPYNRDVGNIFAEELAIALLKDDSIAQHADLIEKALDLLRGVDLVDQVRAKLYKAHGNALVPYRPKEALVSYETALRLDPVKAGVKKIIEELKRDLAKGNVDPESPRDAPSGSQDTEDAAATPAAPASTAPTDSAPATADSAAASGA